MSCCDGTGPEGDSSAGAISAAFPSGAGVNRAAHQFAVRADDASLLLAYGSGENVIISAESSEGCPQAMLRHAGQIQCIAWHPSLPMLAVGTQERVCVYQSETVGGTGGWSRISVLEHDEPVTVLAWTERGLWSSGSTIKLWRIAAEQEAWHVIWSSTLSQRVARMAASCSGEHLATAAAQDRLLKVWSPLPTKPAQDSALGAAQQHRRQPPQSPQDVDVISASPVYTFCYLRHPRALHAFEWRPAPWKRRSGLGLHEHEQVSTSSHLDRPILLTLCMDGVARLWSVAETTCENRLSFSLCATLMLDNCRLAGDGNAGHASLPSGSAVGLQFVQWLQVRPIEP
jgi:WD40 repeat protein